MAEEKKKKSTAELIEDLTLVIERLVDRVEGLEQRTEEHDGRLEAHAKMFREEAAVEEQVKGMEKEEYPRWCHDLVDNPASSVKWVRVVPRMNYNKPGITIQGFTVPFHQGVPTWTLTTFQEEAIKREVL